MAQAYRRTEKLLLENREKLQAVSWRGWFVGFVTGIVCLDALCALELSCGSVSVVLEGLLVGLICEQVAVNCLSPRLGAGHRKKCAFFSRECFS